MKLLHKLIVLLPVMLLAACASQTQKQYEACIVGSMAVGGGAGGAISGGVGAVPGIVVGALASQLLCREVESPAIAIAAPTPAQVAPTDSDRDGVVDSVDRCPGTPAGVAVDRNGCPLDSDGDGVADYLDRCASTPAGIRVDSNGCPLPGERIVTLGDVNFAFDRSELRPEARPNLEAAVAVLRSQSSAQLDLVGHTDNVGSDAYNEALSLRRAESVRSHLVSQGIDASRLNVVGKGESSPEDSNDTDEGRAANRRVEFIVR